MRNVEFLAKTIFSSLSDADLINLKLYLQKETDKRHLTHGECTPQTCTVIAENHERLRNAVTGIRDALWMA
jgi:hypothetical protein